MTTRIKNYIVAIAIALPAVSLAADAPAPSASITVSEITTTPCNTTSVKALGFITVGRATLYRNDCVGASPLSAPLALEFGYKREIPGSAMGKAASVMIERNVDDEVFNRLQARIEAFNDAYRDIRPGDRYQLLYSSAGEIVLQYNGETVAREQGHDFARTYLQIWFGPDPYSEDMKQALLNGLQP